jgi:hypothetical protein
MFRDLASVLDGYEVTDRDCWHCLSEGLGHRVAEAWDGSAGFAVVLTGFDVFVRHRVDDAHSLLEIIAEQAWPAALLGRWLICLAQSDDPALRLRRIGMWTLPWFDHEPTAWPNITTETDPAGGGTTT